MKFGMKSVVGSIAVIGAVVISGCGSSSSSTPPPVEVAYNGVLIDSAVAGITWECGGVTGMTDAAGNFGTCPAGSTATFSIGNLVLGDSSATADGVFFVTDLVGVERTDTDNADVLKIASFLQSLDADGNPDNGITITEDITNEVNLLAPAGTVLTDAAGEIIYASIGAIITSVQVLDPVTYADMVIVTVDEALENLNESLVDIVNDVYEPEEVTGS